MEQINKSIQYGAVTIKNVNVRNRSLNEAWDTAKEAAKGRVRWKAAVEGPSSQVE